ncbi:MAG: hypothetical protein ABIC57_00025, partial [bacterium]
VTGGTLIIESDFTTPDDSQCLFISDGDIKIEGGFFNGGTIDRGVEPPVVLPDNYDTIEASFIVDGRFIVEDDNEERLEITGSVFAGNTDFKRDLSVLVNAQLPSVLIRYISLSNIFSDVFPQRLYHQFECGINDSLPACEGWE